jgi:heptosyltransferase II
MMDIVQKISISYVLNRLKLQQFFVKGIGSILFRKKNIEPPQTILILRINLLRVKYPKAKILFLTTFVSNKETVAGSKKYLGNSNNILPWFNFIYPSIVDEVYCINNFSLEQLSHFRGKIKEQNIDVTFILPHPGDHPLGLLKKIILLKILGISKNVFGYSVKADYSFGRKIQNNLGLFTHKVIGPIEAIKEYNKLLYLNNTQVSFPLSIPNETKEWVTTILDNIPKSKMIISLAIGSIQLHKRWQVGNFVELAKKISEYCNAFFIVVGTKNDSEIGQYFENQLNTTAVLNLINKTSVQQLAVILERSDVLIGNDGGAIQLGAAVNCKTISIISGIEYPNSVDPWGFGDYTVRHKVACSPCYSMTSCPLIHNHCITEITVDKVFSQFLKVAEIIKDIKDIQSSKVLK